MPTALDASTALFLLEIAGTHRVPLIPRAGMAFTKALHNHDRGHFHAVRFYDSDASLAQIVGHFVADGLAAGLPAIVIATPDHRRAIEVILGSLSFDVAELESSGDLLMFDAADTLAQFMVEGMPDPVRFRRALIPIIEAACRGGQDCVVRAYGEMVDVLWKAGQTVAAIRLETLWNDLARSHAFSLLCGYSMGNFYKDAAVGEITRQHTHLLADTGEVATVN